MREIATTTTTTKPTPLDPLFCFHPSSSFSSPPLSSSSLSTQRSCCKFLPSMSCLITCHEKHSHRPAWSNLKTQTRALPGTRGPHSPKIRAEQFSKHTLCSTFHQVSAKFTQQACRGIRYLGFLVCVWLLGKSKGAQPLNKKCGVLVELPSFGGLRRSSGFWPGSWASLAICPALGDRSLIRFLTRRCCTADVQDTDRVLYEQRVGHNLFGERLFATLEERRALMAVPFPVSHEGMEIQNGCQLVGVVRGLRAQPGTLGCVGVMCDSFKAGLSDGQGFSYLSSASHSPGTGAVWMWTHFSVERFW